MTSLLNPNWKPHLELVEDDAAWDALKLVITDYLDANADTSMLDLATIRALDAEFSDDLIWSQILGDLGITEIPDE